MKKGILLIVFCFCTIVSFAQNSSFLKVLKFEEEQFKLGVKLERIEASLKESIFAIFPRAIEKFRERNGCVLFKQ